MGSLEEDIEANETTLLRSAPWLRLAHLRERLAEASYAPEAFRTELKAANTKPDAGGRLPGELDGADPG